MTSKPNLRNDVFMNCNVSEETNYLLFKLTDLWLKQVGKYETPHIHSITRKLFDMKEEKELNPDGEDEEQNHLFLFFVYARYLQWIGKKVLKLESRPLRTFRP